MHLSDAETITLFICITAVIVTSMVLRYLKNKRG